MSHTEETQVLPEGVRTIIRSVVGSTAYGTNVDGNNDRDEMAIAIEPLEYVVGLKHWETSITRTQPQGVRSQPGDLDLVTHSLRKFARLAAKGNPTILLMLFCPPIRTDWQGRELLYYRDRFLSRQAGKAFLGYMKAQRMRMNGESGGRHGAMRVELVEKYGFDTKYAGHIIRLGYQGIELMERGRMTLPMRQEERERVLAIRTGKVPVSEVLQQALDMEESLKALMNTSPLPEEPDNAGIDKLMTDCYLRTWDEMKRQPPTAAGEP